MKKSMCAKWFEIKLWKNIMAQLSRQKFDVFIMN